MKRSILSLMYLIQGIRHARIDIDQKLVEIGLNENAIDPSSTIHRSLEWDVLEFLGESIEPEQGLAVGQHYSFVGYGPLLMLLMASNSIQKFLEKGLGYSRLSHLTGQLYVQYTKDKIALIVESVNLETQLGYFLAPCEVLGTYRFI